MLGGIAREQVCIYMCPWPRIQGAMVDHETLLVTYRAYRGEPRGAHKKGQAWEDRGDCIDCKACVAVCPTGIDIRDGSQLECIQCALCIDACNDIMGKVGRPARADRLRHHRRAGGRRARARTAQAAARARRARCSMPASSPAWARSCWPPCCCARRSRSTCCTTAIRPSLLLSDGGIRNAYTVKILNKLHEPRAFRLAAEGLPAAQARHRRHGGDPGTIRVTTDDLREFRVLVTVPAAAVSRLDRGPTPFQLVVTDSASGQINERMTHFQR